MVMWEMVVMPQEKYQEKVKEQAQGFHDWLIKDLFNSPKGKFIMAQTKAGIFPMSVLCVPMEEEKGVDNG